MKSIYLPTLKLNITAGEKFLYESCGVVEDLPGKVREIMDSINAAQSEIEKQVKAAEMQKGIAVFLWRDCSGIEEAMQGSGVVYSFTAARKLGNSSLETQILGHEEMHILLECAGDKEHNYGLFTEALKESGFDTKGIGRYINENSRDLDVMHMLAHIGGFYAMLINGSHKLKARLPKEKDSSFPLAIDLVKKYGPAGLDINVVFEH